MKAVLSIAVLAVVCGVLYASDPGYGYGGHKGGYGYGDPETRVYNAKRQLYVNEVARKVGSGTGTAYKDGVPGTYFGRNHGYGYGGHGYGGYAGYGYGNYGSSGNYGYNGGYGYGDNFRHGGNRYDGSYY